MERVVTDIRPETLRQVLGTFCTGVTVITAVDDGEPVGMACQSFSSLSLEPALISFFPARTSTTWPRIRTAGRFAVNVLAADQRELCKAFAVSGADKFAGVEWAPGQGGSPILAGALSWIEAEIDQEIPAGDHSIVIGRVTALAATRDETPLVFFRSRFGHAVTPCS